MSPSAASRCLLAVVLLVAPSACTYSSTSSYGASRATAAPPPGWTRQSFRQPGIRCSNQNCRSTLNGPGISIAVETRAKEYARHEVPGWNQSRGTRVGNAIGGALVRGIGLTTENVKVGHGTRLVTEAGPDGWRLSCDVTWLLTEDVHKGSGDIDEVVGTVLNSQGMDCRAAPHADSMMSGGRWRFARGIVPKWESLARVIDSLSTLNSELLLASPPMTLERLTADGRVSATYEAVLESSGRMRISRDDRTLVARLYWGMGATVDISGAATDDEKHLARLIASAMAIQLRTRV
jgi:hypothetical protein